jgi:diaminopimelate epimerase
VSDIRFEKWQALGNDYLILEREGLSWELNAERVRRLCDPHFGVGADGVLLLRRLDGDAAVAELRIFNPDGSEAELSGNGARQAALYVHRHGWSEADTFTLKTPAGPVEPTVTSPRTCTMAMGRASTASEHFPSGPSDGRGRLSAAGREWDFQHVAIGNPQCAIEVAEGLEDLDLSVIGPAIERHELFPNRTNVSFFRVDGDRVRARIFERGVGETLSSGTGASGAAVAAHLGGAPNPLMVVLDGGELDVEVSADLDVRIAGWAEPLCAGELSDELAGHLSQL